MRRQPIFPSYPVEYVVSENSPSKTTEQLIRANMVEPYGISRLYTRIKEYGGSDPYGIPGHSEITCSQVLEDLLKNRRLLESIVPIPVQPDWSVYQLDIWERIFNHLSQKQGTFGICGQVADHFAAVGANRKLGRKLALEPTLEKYMFDHTAPGADFPNMTFRKQHSDVIEIDYNAVKVVTTPDGLRKAIHHNSSKTALMVAMFLDFAQYGHYTHWMACPAIIWAKKDDLPRLLSTRILRQLIKTKSIPSSDEETEWVIFMGDTDPFGLAFETPAFLAPFDKAADAIINVFHDVPRVKGEVLGKNLAVKDEERKGNENIAWLTIK